MRYSEDIDLNVLHVAKDTLQKRMRKALASRSLASMLAAKGIAIAKVTEGKQTETTQRWKVELSASGSRGVVRTKVEFSRRGPDTGEGIEFGAVDVRIAHAYGIVPPLLHHYSVAEATRQKIDALADRKETQARDVFDLDLLFARKPALHVDEELREQATSSAERAVSLTYDEYAGQVVAFLESEFQELYRDRAHWDAMRERVVAALHAIMRDEGTR